MQIVKLQCPACGAAITAPRDAQEFSCTYCGTRLATVQHDGSASLVESKPEPRPETQAVSPPVADISIPDSVVANGRGCVAALIMWIFVGPLLVLLLMLPLVMIAPSDPEGHVLLPDAVSACVGLAWIAGPLLLAVYAFFYFRRRENSVLGYFTKPFRWIRRRE